MPTLVLDEQTPDSAADTPAVRPRPRRARRVLLAAGALALLVAAWLAGQPWAASALAQAMPAALEQELGQGMLHTLDGQTLHPSTLAPEQRRRLSAAFLGLRAPHEGLPAYRLHFRSGGVSVLALPSGDIVLGDELVRALPDDGAVLAVLAHELGHLRRRHLLHRLVRGSMLASAGSLLEGQAHGLAQRTAAPALRLQFDHSEELAADSYAAAVLEQNGLAADGLEQVLHGLGQADASNIYFSMHPLSGERLAGWRSRAP